MMIKKLLAAGIIAATATVYGGTFKTVDGFSITLPAGWTKIPGTVLQHLSQSASARHPGSPIVFDYGYQLKVSDDHDVSPYILVQFKAVDPAIMDQVGQGSAQQASLAQGVETAMRSFPRKVSDVTVSGPTYDAANDMLWASMGMDVEGYENMKALVGVKRMKTGLIQFNGYAPADKFDDYVQRFKQAFSSVVIDDSLGYQPPMLQPAQPLQQEGGYSLGRACLYAGLLGSAMWLIKIIVVRGIKKVLVRAREWTRDAHTSSASSRIS